MSAANAIKNDEVEQPVLVFEHPAALASKGVSWKVGPKTQNMVINTSTINKVFKGTIGHHLTIGVPLPFYRIDQFQVFSAGETVDAVAKLDQYLYPVSRDGHHVGEIIVRKPKNMPTVELKVVGMLPMSKLPDFDIWQEVGTLDEVKTRSFEARVIFNAFGDENNVLWLKSTDAGADLFYAYRVDMVDRVETVIGVHLYTEAEFIDRRRAWNGGLGSTNNSIGK